MDINDVRDSWKSVHGRDLNGEELIAFGDIEKRPARLGLFEWRTTDGEIYYGSRQAIAHQVGINRKLSNS